jgi:hypothetical protein
MTTNPSTTFRLEVLGFSILEEIEGSWTEKDFQQLAERLELGDLSALNAAEQREMCVLALGDLKPATAAALLLELRLGDSLNKGQIENASHEMLDEKLWEESADMPLHERFFHVGSLLYQAFPRTMPRPDAVELRARLTALDAVGLRLISAPLLESLLVRLLADGMPDSAPLNRLFGESVRGSSFPEAESIVWISNVGPLQGSAREFRVIGSGYWFDALRETKSYGSSARPDGPSPH